MVVLKIVIEILLIMVGIVVVMGYFAIRPSRLPISLTPESLGLNYEQLNLKATDGLTLSGWFIPSPRAKATIICCHGYPANKSDILPFVKFLHPQFNLLLFDFRAHGESGGKAVTFGITEPRDVWGAVKYLQNRPDTASLPIGIWGYSMGGAVAIIAASEDKSIRAIVSDSAYANFPEMTVRQFGLLGPLKYPLAGIANLLGRALFRVDPSRASPEEVINKVDVPVLFIHAEFDSVTPVEHAKRLYSKANQPKELWIRGRDYHTSISPENTISYETRVLSFFQKHLLKE